MDGTSCTRTRFIQTLKPTALGDAEAGSWCPARLARAMLKLEHSQPAIPANILIHPDPLCSPPTRQLANPHPVPRVTCNEGQLVAPSIGRLRFALCTSAPVRSRQHFHSSTRARPAVVDGHLFISCLDLLPLSSRRRRCRCRCRRYYRCRCHPRCRRAK